jgi:hypothetical protein
MKSHVGISFTMLECAWKSDVEISCKLKVAYSCMWIAPYIQYCIQNKMLIGIATTYPLAPKAI